MARLAEAALKATNEWAIAADWQQNLAIANRCTGVLESESVLNVIFQRLNESNPELNMRALELLQACMQNSFSMVQALHKSSAQTSIREAVNRMSDYRVKNKLLNMVRAWAEAYEGDRIFPNFETTYLNLQMANVPFPGKDDDSNYSKPSPPEAARMYDSRPSRSRRGVAALAQQMPSTSAIQQPVVQPQIPPQYSRYPVAGQAQAAPQPYPSPQVGAPVGRAGQQLPAPQVAAQQQQRVLTVSYMNEMLSSQTLLREVLGAMTAGVDVGNDLVQELRGACDAARKAILEKIATEQNESLLMLMLQFNDAFVELDTIYSDLCHAHQNAPRAPSSARPVAPATVSYPAQSASSPYSTSQPAPSNRIGGLDSAGGMLTLDLDVEHLVPKTSSTQHQPWLPLGESNDDLKIPSPAVGKPSNPLPRPVQPAKPSSPPVDLLSLTSPPPTSSGNSTPSADDDFDDFFDQIAKRDRSKSGTAASFGSAPSSTGSDLLSAMAPTSPTPAAPSTGSVSPTAGLLDILSQPLSPSSPQTAPNGYNMGNNAMNRGMIPQGTFPMLPQQMTPQQMQQQQYQMQQMQQQQQQQSGGFLQSQFGNMNLR